jgi:hypothetical protein
MMEHYRSSWEQAVSLRIIDLDFGEISHLSFIKLHVSCLEATEIQSMQLAMAQFFCHRSTHKTDHFWP